VSDRRHEEEMRRALITDGEKLAALSGEDHGPWDLVTEEDAMMIASDITGMSPCEVRQSFFWESSARRLSAYIVGQTPVAAGNEWIEWDGGEQPVADEVRLEVVLQNGMQYEEYSDEIRWNKKNDRDVGRYRLAT